MRAPGRLAAGLALWLATTLPAAAEVLWTGGSDCQIALRGQIGPEEDTRLRSILRARGLLIAPDFVRDEDAPLRLCLDSPGGSLMGGVRLARVLNEQGIGTVLPERARCLSACTLPFMMGTVFASSEFRTIDRRMHPSARLGFHRPALTAPDRSYTAEQLERVYDLSTRAIAEALTVFTEVTELNGVPYGRADLLHQMLSHVGEDFFYIDTVGKALRWNVAVTDLPRVRHLTVREAAHACWNMFEANNNFSPDRHARRFDGSMFWPARDPEDPWAIDLTTPGGGRYYQVPADGGVYTQSGCYIADTGDANYMPGEVGGIVEGCYYGRGNMQFAAGGWCGDKGDALAFADNMTAIPAIALHPIATPLSQLPRRAGALARQSRPAALPRGAAWRQVVRVAADDVLWVRSCGSPECRKLGSLAPGQRGIYTTDCEGRWCKVHDRTGRMLGWSHAGYLETVAGP